MKDVLIIAHFTQVPGEKGNGRFHYIAQKLGISGTNIELVTSSFSHRTKKQRNITKDQNESINYKLTLLYEPGYFKNVSLKRLFSHYIMSKSLKSYLVQRKKPDVIYCAIPSLSVAKVAAEYASRNNIRFVIDIQDLWPEAFGMIINIPIITDILFYPMKQIANYIYSSADDIIAVSKTYIRRALIVNDKHKESYSVYLGTELSHFDKLAEEYKFDQKPSGEIWIAYIGTLGHSYDLYTVIDALKILVDRGIKNVKFIVMGDGPLKYKFECYAKKQQVYAEFTGRLEYNKMVGLLKACDIAVNPIRSGSAGSIINKVGDYAAAGLPVINTQECKEYRELLEEHGAGYNCKNKDPIDIANKVMKLCDEKLRQKVGSNNRIIALNYFDRELTYRKIFEVLEK